MIRIALTLILLSTLAGVCCFSARPRERSDSARTDLEVKPKSPSITGSHYDLLIKNAEQDVRKDPNDKNIRARVALLYSCRAEEKMRLGLDSEALSDLDQSLKVERNLRALGDRSDLRETMGDLSGALSDCNESIRIRPYPSTYFSRSRIKNKMGDIKGASEDETKRTQLIKEDE